MVRTIQKELSGAITPKVLSAASVGVGTFIATIALTVTEVPLTAYLPMAIVAGGFSGGMFYILRHLSKRGFVGHLFRWLGALVVAVGPLAFLIPSELPTARASLEAAGVVLLMAGVMATMTVRAEMVGGIRSARDTN